MDPNEKLDISKSKITNEIKSRKRYRIQCWTEDPGEKIKIMRKSVEDKAVQTETEELERTMWTNSIQNTIFDSLKNILEKNLDCGICKEVYLDSCILPCGHIFCSYCIRMWFLHADTCPICRITTEFVIGTKVIDNFLKEILSTCDKEFVETRETMIVDRKAVLQRVEANWVVQNSSNFYSSPEMWQDWLNSQTTNPEALDLNVANNLDHNHNTNNFTLTDERAISNLWPWDSDESFGVYSTIDDQALNALNGDNVQNNIEQEPDL